MTYEEVKVISKRLKPLGDLSVDVRLDNTRLGEQPEFYYYGVEIGLCREDNITTAVKLTINEHPDNNGIWLYKCNYDYLYTEQQQEQQEIYDACKQVVRDYLNGNLLKGEVKEWKII